MNAEPPDVRRTAPGVWGRVAITVAIASQLQSRVTQLEHAASGTPEQHTADGADEPPQSDVSGQSPRIRWTNSTYFHRADTDTNVGATVFITRGGEKFQAGDLAGAEAAYREATRVDPDSADALAVLGVVQLARKEVADAESSSQRSLKLRSNTRALLTLAQIRFGQKRFQEAHYARGRVSLLEHAVKH